MSVYQSELFANALSLSGETKIVLEAEGAKLVCVEKIRKIPFLGEKKIIFCSGLPEKGDNILIKLLEEFKTRSEEYYYGLISPCVLNQKKDIFNKCKFKKVSNYTSLIDLNISEQELFKKLEKKSIRWGIKMAEKNGLRFELPLSEKEIKEFYMLYQNTAKQGKFHAENEKFVSFLSNTEISRLFLVKKDKKIVAGGLILIDNVNKYSILDLTAASEEGLKLQAMPFLYWNLILYSKSLNLNYFDLGGYDNEARKGEKTWNINKFKERFGGEVKEQPIYASNWKYGFFRYLMKKSGSIKGMYKKNE